MDFACPGIFLRPFLGWAMVSLLFAAVYFPSVTVRGVSDLYIRAVAAAAQSISFFCQF
jgi:hypothetical protein